MKLRQNWFPIPNKLVDEVMCRLSGNELKCYMAVMRQTVGWNKASDLISLSRLEEITGLKTRVIQRAMSRLIEHGLIEREPKQGAISGYKMREVVSNLTQEEEEVVSNLTPPSVKSDTGGSVKSDTLQKTLITKDTITKDNTPPASRVAPKRKTKIPDDFSLTAEMATSAVNYWAEKNRQDLDAAEQFDEFLNHHRANGKAMASWPHAWKTWYVNAIKFNRKPHEVYQRFNPKPVRLSPYQQRVLARQQSNQTFDHGQY